MDDLWARLRKATHDDEPLLDFLQHLLTLDPGPRANFAELVKTHPYLQPSSLSAPPSLASHAAGLVASPAPASSAAAVLKDAINPPLAARPDLDKDVMDRLQPVPGLASFLWDPSCVPVCQMASGAVYRCLI